MPNPFKGEVLCNLDERDFTLVLDEEALMEAEGLYGKPLGLLLAHATLEFYGAVRALFYGSLRAHHPTVSPKEAGEVFFRNQKEVAAAIEEAGKLAAARGVEGKQGSHPPKKVPTGKRSGRSGAKSASTRKPSGGQRRAPTN